MEEENPIAAYNDWLRATLDQEGEARALMHMIQQDEQVPDEETVFQVAQILAIAAWPHESVPPILHSEKLRHNLRYTIEEWTEAAMCLECDSRQQIEERMHEIIVQFNAVLNRVKQ